MFVFHIYKKLQPLRVHIYSSASGSFSKKKKKVLLAFSMTGNLANLTQPFLAASANGIFMKSHMHSFEHKTFNIGQKEIKIMLIINACK